MEKDMLASRRNETFMKTTNALFGILTIIAALAMNGRAQVYQFSTPINGSMTLSVHDADGPSGSLGQINLTFTNLTETVYLDAQAQTIRQVGTVLYTCSATNIMSQETQSVSVFPHPPVNVSGTVTANLALNGGSLSFDTGPKPVTWSAALQAYSFDGNIGNISADCSWTLTTGGQRFTGSFTYSMYPDLGAANTFSYVSMVNYPSSLGLSGFTSGGSPWFAYQCFDVVGQTQATATNGFNMQLVPGIANCNGNNGSCEGFSWSANPVTATNVPIGAASITNQPQSVLVHAHDTASFSVAASGTVPLRYQWSFNGTNISGASLSSLTISNVVQANLGTYAVVVTNAFGWAASSNATLIMYPYIATPFVGAVTYWGKPATFGIQGWGTGPLSYQWFKDGAVVLNGTNTSLSFLSTQVTNAGLYSVVVTSLLGIVTNMPAQVVVYPAGVSLGFCPSVTISGVVGYSYIIQSTMDLTKTNSWVTLTNLTLTQPVELWVDTSVDVTLPANSKYFYRVLPGQ